MKLLCLLLLLLPASSNALAQIGGQRSSRCLAVLLVHARSRRAGWTPDEGACLQYPETIDKDQEADLWIVSVDGSNMMLLVRNGFEPSWAK